MSDPEPYPLPPEPQPSSEPRKIPACDFCTLCGVRGTLDETGICLACREAVDREKQAITDRWLMDGE